MLLASGVRFAFAVFLVPIEADLGWDRASLSAAASLNALAYGLSQFAVGFLVDRWGPRRVMLAGLALLAMASLATAFVSELWHLALLQGLLPGAAFAAAGLVPAGAMLLGWFPRRPALAVGLASAGLPAGQAALLPLIAAVVPRLGWRTTYLALGIGLAALALPPLWLLARDPPRRPAAEPPPRAEPAPASGHSLLVALSLAFLACGFTDQLVTLHLVAFATGVGLPPVVAASSQSLLTLVGIAGSVAAGRLADSWTPRGVLVLLYAARAATFPLLFLFAATASPLPLFLFALLFGPTYIANVAPGSRLLRERYGLERLGAFMGLTQFIHQVGAVAGVSLGGLSYSLLGGYQPVFALATAAALGGALACLALPGRQSERQSTVVSRQ